MSFHSVKRFFRFPGRSAEKIKAAADLHLTSSKILSVETESCYYVSYTGNLSEDHLTTLRWLLSETFEQKQFRDEPFLKAEPTEHKFLYEIGPRLNFQTAWSTNAVSICRACGIRNIDRIEKSARILLRFDSSSTMSSPLNAQQENGFLDAIHDRMTECRYLKPLESFQLNVKPEPWTWVPLMEEGSDALRRLNKSMGLAFDDWDIDYYTKLFVEKLKRNPSTVEVFDLSQSNSEHSRHWFFKGRIVIDGEEMAQTPFDLVRETHRKNPSNSVIAFSDNSSAINGFSVHYLKPTHPGQPSALSSSSCSLLDITFTAETHNFPTGVAPFPGAETGTGGRLRDSHACGRGSLVVAGLTGYCVGQLLLPNYSLPWEHSDWAYPPNMATPLQIEIEASNGASDYGNKFGEPVVLGFTRSFGLRLPSGERREWVKPIMFAGGIGQMSAAHRKKGAPEVGMLVVKIGGPAYRIGIGGGAASSLSQGQNDASLDFNAVQRGDAEMESKLNRVIRACVELGDRNPIVSIHDQGAGGNANVLKEIVEPAGARIELRKIIVADETLSVLEIWGAEYQEADALLMRAEDAQLFDAICSREGCPYSIVGKVTGDGKIVLHDERDNSTPVNLDLETVLGKMPQKVFKSQRSASKGVPLSIPVTVTTVRSVLDRVLRLLSVGSKRFLVNKVDRSVTGLVAQQPCVGPLQLTTSDYAVIAQSHNGLSGAATAVGEQPIKGLLDTKAMARMAVGEALTNIAFVKVTALEHIKCRGNWMWAAKFPNEAAALYDAAKACSDLMISLGIAIDGGKDSLSMAAKVGDEVVKAPGSLVVPIYCTVKDITRKVTPEIRHAGASILLLIEAGAGNGSRQRLGGSALAHVFEQLGDQSPDVDDASQLKNSFEAVQSLVDARLISAGHDRSDGGLITTLLEMAFSGNCGLDIDLPASCAGSSGKDFLESVLAPLFNEELGMVVEVPTANLQKVTTQLSEHHVTFHSIGKTAASNSISVKICGKSVLESDMVELRDVWEQTSFELEKRQTNLVCVNQEREGLRNRRPPPYHLTFDIVAPITQHLSSGAPKVAVIREEGSNGDREMSAAFHMAGFEVWDVKMSDLLEEKISLSQFRGVAFVGGFSYADVMDSAKGWAGVIRFNAKLQRVFDEFYAREDTFSLGICNGCQLMALMGWIPTKGLAGDRQPRFIHNQSGRLESRWVTVRIQNSPAVMFRQMEGSVLGVWSVHGEGKAHFPDAEILSQVLKSNLAPVRFVDDDANPTEVYPFNPSGSTHGIAGLCSPDGRHLAMMPHSERSFMKWQWPYTPLEWEQRLPHSHHASPWLKMFVNAFEWCQQTSKNKK